jgi:hypothetical protein
MTINTLIARNNIVFLICRSFFDQQEYGAVILTPENDYDEISST